MALRETRSGSGTSCWWHNSCYPSLRGSEPGPPAHQQRYESVQFPRVADANVPSSVEPGAKDFTVIPPYSISQSRGGVLSVRPSVCGLLCAAFGEACKLVCVL